MPNKPSWPSPLVSLKRHYREPAGSPPWFRHNLFTRSPRSRPRLAKLLRETAAWTTGEETLGPGPRSCADRHRRRRSGRRAGGRRAAKPRSRPPGLGSGIPRGHAPPPERGTLGRRLLGRLLADPVEDGELGKAAGRGRVWQYV